MLCDACKVEMISGTPAIVNSSFAVGVKVEDTYLGGMICHICPDCGKVELQLSDKAKQKLDKKRGLL